MAHDLKTTKHLFNDMCQIYYQFLDERIKPKTNTKNQFELVFKDPRGGIGLESIIGTATAGHTGSGHGHTYHTACLSEFSRWPNYESLEGLTQAIPTGEDAPGTAIIIESVAKISGDLFNHKYEQARSGDSQYDAFFLPWYLHTEYREPVPEKWEWESEWKEFKEIYSLDDKQVMWYYNKWRELEDENPGRGWDKVRMLYPGNEQEAWISTGSSAFNMNGIEYLATKVKQPIGSGEYVGDRFQINWGRDLKGRLKVWEKPRGGIQYVVGADIALRCWRK